MESDATKDNPKDETRAALNFLFLARVNLSLTHSVVYSKVSMYLTAIGDGLLQEKYGGVYKNSMVKYLPFLLILKYNVDFNEIK